MALDKLRCAPVHFTVWKVIFDTESLKITVHTVKCTGAHRNFSSATGYYSNVTTQIAQNIAETCQEYLQYFIEIGILSKQFC